MEVVRQRVSSTSTRFAGDSKTSSPGPFQVSRTGAVPAAMKTSPRAASGAPAGRSATWVAREFPQRTSNTSACVRPSGERAWARSREAQGASAGERRQSQSDASPIASMRANSATSSFKA